MRIYQDVFEMHSEVKRDIHEMGVVVHPMSMQDKDVSEDEAFKTLELSPCDFAILNGDRVFEWIESLGLNPGWLEADFEERWSAFHGRSVNPGNAWKLREDTWYEFLHDGTFSYTYSERFSRNNALKRLVNELKRNPDTRQAILPMFNGDLDHHNLGGKERIPCTMHYQFLRRPDGLRAYYVMRSTDFVTHFPYDISLAMLIQQRIAFELKCEVGLFTFFTGSLHIFKKDADPGVF